MLEPLVDGHRLGSVDETTVVDDFFFFTLILSTPLFETLLIIATLNLWYFHESRYIIPKVGQSQDEIVSALATLNLCFWPKLRCTCPRRDQGQHIIPREGELG